MIKTEDRPSKSDDTDTSLYERRRIVTPYERGFWTGQFHAGGNYAIRLGIALTDLSAFQMMTLFGATHSDLHKLAQDIKMRNIKLRLDVLGGLTYKTASLGLYEVLTEKLRSRNRGRPLSLYKEACCGLTSGAVAAVVWRPFMLASPKTAAENWTYKNLLSTLYNIVRNEGVLSLWRGSGLYTSTVMAAHMGMLASYHRSLNYLYQFENLHEINAQLGAGVISGFFAAACSHPCRYMLKISKILCRSDIMVAKSVLIEIFLILFIKFSIRIVASNSTAGSSRVSNTVVCFALFSGGYTKLSRLQNNLDSCWIYTQKCAFVRAF